jgi:hypothetical protein
MRLASDAEPRIRTPIGGPRRPPGLPELNALAQVIAMSVDVDRPPDLHPLSDESCDASSSVRLAEKQSSERRTGGLGTGSGDAMGAQEQDPVTELRLGTVTWRGQVTLSSAALTTKDCTRVTIVYGSPHRGGPRVRSAG